MFIYFTYFILSASIQIHVKKKCFNRFNECSSRVALDSKCAWSKTPLVIEFDTSVLQCTECLHSSLVAVSVGYLND